MTTSPLQPIATHYKGYRFRSRLEARWAVFFDHLGVPWQYEPQGYLINGQPYLPDFLIYPDNNPNWIEIKGRQPEEAEIELIHGLADHTGLDAYLYFQPPGSSEQTQGETAYRSQRDHKNRAMRLLWTDCPVCGQIRLKLNQWAGWCPYEADDTEPKSLRYVSDTPRLLAAFNAARSARFEHGEQP